MLSGFASITANGKNIVRVWAGPEIIWEAGSATAPTAVDDTATVTAGQTIDVDVLANDIGDNLEIISIGGDYTAYASIVATGEGQRIRFTTLAA